MELRPLQILVAALTLTLAQGASAGVNRWTSQGPYGANVLELTTDPARPSIVYATTNNGLFKSADRGTIWTSIHLSVTSLAIDPENPATLYGGASGKVLKSTDRGRRWREASAGLPQRDRPIPAISTLAIDPENPAILYAGYRDDGLYRSTDGGATWQAVEAFPEPGVRDVAVDPADAATLYAATGGGVYRSTDSGDRWLRIAEGSHDLVVADAGHPGTVFASGTRDRSPHQLFRSRDRGLTWTGLSFGGSARLSVFALAPSDTDVLYVAAVSDSAGTDIFRSTDGGDTWSPGSIAAAGRSPRALGVDSADPAIVYVGTDREGGVFRSTDGGVTFTQTLHGLLNTWIEDLDIDPVTPSNVYAMAAYGLFRSADGGATWTERSLPNARSLAIDPTAPTILYAGGGTGGIFRSTNAGESWVEIADADAIPGSVVNVEIDPGNPSTIYAGSTPRGVYRSPDGGATWTLGGEIRPQAGLYAFEMDPASPSTLYALTVNLDLRGRVSKSLDGGDTWFFADDGLPGSIYTSLTIDPLDSETLYVTGVHFGVFKSIDGGASWLRAGDLPPQSTYAVVVDPRNSSTVYAATRSGVMKSIDGGETWYPLDEGLTDPAYTLEIDPQQPEILYAGTQRAGVFDLTQDFDCEPGARNLCLDDQPGDQRFEITLTYDTELGAGGGGDGEATPLGLLGATRGGVLSFFDAANPEMLIKVLDGCAINGHYWVYYAATTNAGFRLQVTDTNAGISQLYVNPDQSLAATVTDVGAFPCASGPSGSSGQRPGGNAPVLPVTSLTGTRPTPRSAEESLGGCAANSTTLCIHDQPGDGRFRISAAYDTALGQGAAGAAAAISLAPLGITRGGILWFFEESNPEILVKVLDGCDFNGRYWIFYAATTTAGFTLTVEDTVAGEKRVFENPDFLAAVPVADIQAFATCGLDGSSP